MKLSELKSKFLIESDSFSKDEKRILISLLLEHGLGISRMQQLAEPDLNFKSEQIQYLQEGEKQLLQGRPIQQILKRTDFFNMELEVNENTLIPRPETEELLQLIKEDLGSIPTSALDIGTGSGCIALGLKQIFPKAKVLGLDISADALLVARRNASRNHLDVAFIEGSILESESFKPNHSFDLIVSNPPYIAWSEKESMSKTVKDYEPHLALFVENQDPLQFYKAIEVFAMENLSAQGSLFLEINQRLGEETKSVFTEKGWKANLYKDMSGNDRFLKVWR